MSDESIPLPKDYTLDNILYFFSFKNFEHGKYVLFSPLSCLEIDGSRCRNVLALSVSVTGVGQSPTRSRARRTQSDWSLLKYKLSSLLLSESRTEHYHGLLTCSPIGQQST